MKTLNDKLLNVVGEILTTLLSEAAHEEDLGEKTNTFRDMYRGSAQGKKEFIKTVFQILKDKDVIDEDQALLMDSGFYLDTATVRWSELAAEILEDTKRKEG